MKKPPSFACIRGVRGINITMIFDLIYIVKDYEVYKTSVKY